MFLASSLSTLCSLLTLLGSVGAQSPSLPPSAIGPPASSPAQSSLSSLPSMFSSLPTEPSSTSLGYSSTSPPVSLTSLGPPVTTGDFSTIGNVLKPEITSWTFVPFPAPSESSIPKVFPETYPDNPPPPGDWAIPNFGPAWAAAYGKATARVSRFLVSPALLPFKYSRAWVIITGSRIDARRESQYHHWSRLDEWSMCWEHTASWGLPRALFGSMFRMLSWGMILKALIGLSTRSKVHRLYHCIPGRDKHRCDVSFGHRSSPCGSSHDNTGGIGD